MDAYQPAHPTPEVLEGAYRTMQTIRTFEERLHLEFTSGDIPGAVHLSTGQEAVAAGFCAHLGEEDYIASTHRGHGHAIAKGCDLTGMMLEIYGKSGGLCGGKGGSMHIADFELGMLGANGIAGAGAPLACGAALSAKMRGTHQVAVAFVGDGGANQGAFLESLNLAAVWQLPVVFVVENNGYAQTTAASYALAGVDVSARAAGFGLPGVTVDGTDFHAVYRAADEAVLRARSGHGPTLVECRTARFRGHMEGFDAQRYRAADEVDRLRAGSDGLLRLADLLTVTGQCTEAQLTAWDTEIAAQVDAAVATAKSAPAPALEELVTHAYASH